MTFADLLRQVIENALYNANITSANPYHVNKVFAVDINTADFDELLTKEIEDIVNETVKDLSPTTERKTEEGLTESGAVALARNGISTVQDPVSIVTTGLQYLPHAALIGLALSLIPLILKELTRAGGPLDLRWKRIMENEFNAFLDRQTQKNTQLGLRQVIVQSRSGYIAMNGAANENTLRQIREGGIKKDRLANIDFVDHARGLF